MMTQNDWFKQLSATAQLGTHQSAAPALPPFARFAAAQLSSQPEPLMWQQSALCFAYQNATQALPPADNVQPLGFEEDLNERPLPLAAAEILTRWHQQKNRLVKMALYAMRGRAVLPKALLNDDFMHKFDTPQEVLGVRGRYLQQLCGHKAVVKNHQMIDFEHVSHAERMAWLKAERRINPDNARQALESIWKTESAERRLFLLEHLEVGLNVADVPFLQSALKDRSLHVRHCAWQLLERLPCEQSRQLEQWFTERAEWSDGKWHIHDRPFEPAMKDYRLEAISPQKGEADAHFMVRQLMLRLNDDFWSRFWASDVPSALVQFLQNPPIASHVSYPDWKAWAKQSHARIKALLAVRPNKEWLDLFGELNVLEKEEVLQYLGTPEASIAEWVKSNLAGAYVPYDGDTGEQWGVHYSQLMLKLARANRKRWYDGNFEDFIAYLHPSDQSALAALLEEMHHPQSFELNTLFSEKIQFLHIIESQGTAHV